MPPVSRGGEGLLLAHEPLQLQIPITVNSYRFPIACCLWTLQMCLRRKLEAWPALFSESCCVNSWVSNHIGSVGGALLEDRHATNARAPNAGVTLNERYINTSTCFFFIQLFVLHLESARSEELGYFQVQLYVHFTRGIRGLCIPCRPTSWATQICTVNLGNVGFDIPSSIYS